MEEAGIKGKLSRKSIGDYTYNKWSGTCKVEVFDMKVTLVMAKWPEQVRVRRWFSVADAVTKVDERKLKHLIREVGARLSSDDKKK